MKIKLLVVPSLIALIVILSIWIVYPTYSNGSTGVKDNYSKLKIEQAKLDSLRGKSGNVSTLTGQLAALSSDKDVLYGFVPESMNESEIVDNLNKMASDSGLLVYSITIDQPKIDVNVAAAPETLGTTSLDATVPGSASPTAAIPLPTAKSFTTDMEISGDYAQIKDFLNKVNSFARYNDINTLSLKKQILTGTPSAALGSTAPVVAANILTASVVVSFDMLQKAKLSDGNVDDTVFSSSNLDTQVIAKIKERYSVSALPLNVGQAGKSDIFMP